MFDNFNVFCEVINNESCSIRVAEIHWYEAHGIGKKEFKIKLPFLD